MEQRFTRALVALVLATVVVLPAAAAPAAGFSAWDVFEPVLQWFHTATASLDTDEERGPVTDPGGPPSSNGGDEQGGVVDPGGPPTQMGGDERGPETDPGG